MLECKHVNYFLTTSEETDHHLCRQSVAVVNMDSVLYHWGAVTLQQLSLFPNLQLWKLEWRPLLVGACSSSVSSRLLTKFVSLTGSFHWTVMKCCYSLFLACHIEVSLFPGYRGQGLNKTFDIYVYTTTRAEPISTIQFHGLEKQNLLSCWYLFKKTELCCLLWTSAVNNGYMCN